MSKDKKDEKLYTEEDLIRAFEEARVKVKYKFSKGTQSFWKWSDFGQYLEHIKSLKNNYENNYQRTDKKESDYRYLQSII